MENLKLPLYFKDLRRRRHLHLRHCKYQHPHPLQQNTKAKLPEPLCILTSSWLCCSSAASPLLSWNIAAPSTAAAQSHSHPRCGTNHLAHARANPKPCLQTTLCMTALEVLTFREGMPQLNDDLIIVNTVLKTDTVLWSPNQKASVNANRRCSI